MEGLGGAFDFYELGEPLFLEDGSLNEAAGEETMRSYIFYSETRGPLTHPRDPRFKHLLDYSGGVGYFFYYEPDKLTTLGVGTLGIIGPQRAERYVVYADTCNISEVELERMGITFKKIPRDIQRF